MTKPLNECTEQELQEELKKRQQNKDQTEGVDTFLTKKGIKQHQGKGVTIWADSLYILLEAIKGDRESVEYYKREDGLHFPPGQTKVSLLDSAIADAEEILHRLNRPIWAKGDDDHIYNTHENLETICNITLSDIGHVITDIEIDENHPFNDFSTLANDQSAQIMKKILGEPLNDIRMDMIPAYACNIQKVVEAHIRKTIEGELVRLKKSGELHE